MNRLVFLCSTLATAALAHLPFGVGAAAAAGRSARALASRHGGGHCANHRSTTKWSGYSMRDMAG